MMSKYSTTSVLKASSAMINSLVAVKNSANASFDTCTWYPSTDSSLPLIVCVFPSISSTVMAAFKLSIAWLPSL